METLKKLILPYRKRLIAVAVTDAVGMLMLLLMPYVMSYIVDTGIALEDKKTIIYSSLIMLALSVASITNNLIANKLNTYLTVGYTADLCRVTFEKINSLSYNEYSKLGPSGLLARATDDIFNIEGAANTLVNTIVTIPIMLIGSATLAFLADTVLALVFMLVLPLVVFVVFIFMKPLYGMWDKSDSYTDEQNKIVRERLSGIRIIRAFNNEQREHERAEDATRKMAKYRVRANIRFGFIEPIAMLLLNLATVLTVTVGGFRADSGLLGNAGDVIAIIQYVALLSGALINLSWTIAWLPRLKVSIKRINEIHSLNSEDTEESREHKCLSGSPDILVKNLSFTYPEAKSPALSNVDFEARYGEKIAIIGGTGSGKTTLVRLLLGLFDAAPGCIYINGVDYASVKRADIRNCFSAALQKPMIFEGTIRDNVKMGLNDVEDDDILSALSDCAMGDFVKDREEGLSHLLVGGGQNVSGGQKQRLSMARAVLRDADIYIFDDSFSALDFLTESIVMKNLEMRLPGKTRITVTQRVSTAMRADRIYVMDKGRVIASGTHEELAASCTIYREICTSQLGGDYFGGDRNG